MKRRMLASFLLGFPLVMNALGDMSARVFLGLERKENKPEVTSTGMLAQKASGKEDDALKKSMASLLEQMNDQKEHMTMLEPKALKSTDFVIPMSDLYARNPKCCCLQYSNAEAADGGRLKNPSRPAQRQMSEEHPDKDETKNLNEAANEIVNLMHKDYKGMASGKPPINNHEPGN